MNSSNSRRHKWVSVGVGVAPQSQNVVPEKLCCCFVLLIENIHSGNAVLWWLRHRVLCHVSTLNVMFKERFIVRKSLFMNHLYLLRGCGMHREAVPWHSGLSLMMRNAKLGLWSWLFASVKSSDCAQCFWRDEGSGMDVRVLRMCPRRVKVDLSPWEEWGNTHSSSHSCWHVEVGKMGSLIHADILFNILLLVLLLFCLDL